MKTKKLLLALPVMALFVGAMGTMPAFAAETEKTTPVAYDNTQTIPDPDDPTAPTWGVSVPTQIVFTDTQRSVGVDVKLVSIPTGGTGVNDGVGTNVVSIKAKSANGYKVQLADGTDQMTYTMQYGATTATGTNTYVEIASLTAAAAIKAGTATLSGTATQAGMHTDTVTYQISSPVAP